MAKGNRIGCYKRVPFRTIHPDERIETVFADLSEIDHIYHSKSYRVSQIIKIVSFRHIRCYEVMLLIKPRGSMIIFMDTQRNGANTIFLIDGIDTKPISG